MELFRQSDYLYLLLMNAILHKGSVHDKFMFLKRSIYAKGAQYNIAKAIISSSFNTDEVEMFRNIITKLHQHGLITDRKKQELWHIIELKYSLTQEKDTDIEK